MASLLLAVIYVAFISLDCRIRYSDPHGPP